MKENSKKKKDLEMSVEVINPTYNSDLKGRINVKNASEKSQKEKDCESSDSANSSESNSTLK